MRFIDKISDDKQEAENSFFWQLVGPFSVLCTFALMPHNLLLFAVGGIGLYLSGKYRKKGLLYSISLLILGFIVSYFIYRGDLLWIFGVEASFALAFFITNQTADLQLALFESIFNQVDTKSKSILNLEEEILKSSEEMKKKQLALQDKNESLQKQLDEIVLEQSSIVVLNDVLRRKTADQILIAERLEESLLEERVRLDYEKKEKAEIEAEVARLKNESSIDRENKKLIDEINAIRLEKEQTHTINETLARLHAKESIRAQEAIDRLELYKKEQAVAENIEIASLKKALEQKTDEQIQAEFKKEDLKREIASEEIALLKETLSKKENEFNALLAQKESLEEALKTKSYIDSISDQPSVDRLEKKVKELAGIEAKYKQLKSQFEEKNETLGKARQELFQVDTALQTLQKEAALDDRVEGREVFVQFSNLEETISRLEEENKELQDLVSLLSKT